jgi:hypothetical protein
MHVNHLGCLIVVCALAIASVLSAQTTGIPGANDFTINGNGSGGTSPIPLGLSNLDPVIELSVTAPPDHLVFGLAAANVQLGSYSGPPVVLGSLDLEPASLTVWFPAAPLIPGIPFGNVVPGYGNWLMVVPNGVQGGEVLHLQFAVLDPVSGGFSATQAHSGVVGAFSGPISVYQLGDDDFVQHALTVPVEFYGTTHTSMAICDNGFIKFGPGLWSLNWTASTLFSGIPEPGSPAAPVVSPFWTDLNPGGLAGPATYEVWENTLDGTVQVIFRNQEYFVGYEPAGTFGVSFAPASGPAPSSVVFDYGPWIPAVTPASFISILIGLSDGNTAVGPDTDLTAVGGFALALNSYVSPASYDSIAEVFPGTAVLPFALIEFFDGGGLGAPGTWSLYGW